MVSVIMSNRNTLHLLNLFSWNTNTSCFSNEWYSLRKSTSTAMIASFCLSFVSVHTLSRWFVLWFASWFYSVFIQSYRSFIWELILGFCSNHLTYIFCLSRHSFFIFTFLILFQLCNSLLEILTYTLSFDLINYNKKRLLPWKETWRNMKHQHNHKHKLENENWPIAWIDLVLLSNIIHYILIVHHV